MRAPDDANGPGAFAGEGNADVRQRPPDNLPGFELLKASFGDAMQGVADIRRPVGERPGGLANFLFVHSKYPTIFTGSPPLRYTRGTRRLIMAVYSLA